MQIRTEINETEKRKSILKISKMKGGKGGF